MADQSGWRRRRWIFVGLFPVLFALGWLDFRWWWGPEVAVDVVLEREFVQTVVASGRVEAPHRVAVGSQITGTVARVPVVEGQVVKRGEVLIELQSEELRAAVRQAELSVEQARATLRQLREVQLPVAEQALRQALVSDANARAQLLRSEALFSQGFIGQSAVDESRKAADFSDSQLQSAKTQLQSLRTGGSAQTLAEVSVAQALANAEVAKARATYAVIAAVADGTLIARDVEVGDVVQPSKVLMALSPAGPAQLVVQIDEKNLRLLAPSQKAVASADAYSQAHFEAIVSYINPAVNAQTGAVEVKLDVPKVPPMLKQDMTVSVDIEVARRPNAVLVSAGAVHDIDSQAPWVLTVKHGRAVRRLVHLGLRHAGYCEVLDGLLAGDQVIPQSAGLSEGSRLRGVVARLPGG